MKKGNIQDIQTNQKPDQKWAECRVCFRHCRIEEGKTGFCGVRTCRDGQVVPANYGMATALALDPIEKKPLRRFRPGSRILSVGSWGCDLRCPFCQNHEISWGEGVELRSTGSEYISPEDLAETAEHYRSRGNIGVAYTYNEPLCGYEYVRDTAILVHDRGMVNVLVTNGMADLSVLREIRPYMDAMNIDLKAFTHRFYRELLKGDLDMVMAFIREAVKICHVELTTLIIPGENDSDEEMDELSRWISQLTDREGRRIGENIPLHISRFFPQFRMTDREATPVERVYHLKEVAERNLYYVYTGNC